MTPARPRLLPDGTLVGTRCMAARLTARHETVVRHHCQPIACDVATKALLYDLDAAVLQLGRLQRRERMNWRGPRAG